MSREDLMSILRCPDDCSVLRPADVDLLAQLNAKISAARLRNLGGRRVEKRLDGGYLRASGDRLYPVVDQIPVLLVDEAIAIDSDS